MSGLQPGLQFGFLVGPMDPLFDDVNEIDNGAHPIIQQIMLSSLGCIDKGQVELVKV